MSMTASIFPFYHHTPVLLSSIPPLNYPPILEIDINNILIRIGCFGLIYNIILICDIYCYNIIKLLIVSIFGYSYVNFVILKRRSYLSRYGNYIELIRLFYTVIVINYIFNIQFTHYFIISYILSLHFTYLDNSTLLQSIGCKLPLPSEWNRLTLIELFVCIILLDFIVMIILFVVPYTELNLNFIFSYFILLSALIIFSGSIPFSGYFHFHHYLHGIAFLPFFVSNGIISQICCGFAIGLYVEGVTVWGMDPIWVNKRPLDDK